MKNRGRSSVAEDWDTSQWTDSVSGMFEGQLEVPTGNLFRGDIELDLDSEIIESDTYRYLSMGAVGYNPNQSSSPSACAIHISWTPEGGSQTGWYNLSDAFESGPGNGWDQWTVLGPIDMVSLVDSSWDDNDIEEVFLSFRSSKQTPRDRPIDIRIGWIKLENGEM